MQKAINKTILKEYQTMALQSFSDGQIEVIFPNDEDLANVTAILRPNGGFYKDGKFEFAIRLPEDYPNSAPSVTCKTKMFHPNIAYGGTSFNSDTILFGFTHTRQCLFQHPER